MIDGQHTLASTFAAFFQRKKFFMAAKELASFQPEKNFKFFSPTLKEKIKTPDTQANDNADRQ